MATTKAKRKKIETSVLETFRILDKTGRNAERYQAFFKSMSDAQFEKWVKSFLADKDENFFLECMPYDSEPSLEEIEKAAKYLKIPLKETVTFRHLNGVQSSEPVPVGYLNIKRHQQIVSKKTNLSHGIRERNQKTGQVTGSAKAARLTDMDNYALQTMGAEDALAEMMGPRSDDMRKKGQMYEQINLQGFVSDKDLKSTSRDKVTLNTVNSILLGAGIWTDLIGSTLVLPITADTARSQEARDERRKKQRVTG